MRSELLLLCVLSACRCGPERHADRSEERGPARGAAERRRAEVGEDVELLASIGYVDAEEQASGPSGVTRFDPARAQPGTNLVVSAHWRVVLETDLQGRELRRWTLPEAATRPRDPAGFRRAFKTPDDGLIAILEGRGLVRFNATGDMLWRTEEHAHHDVHQLPDGTLVALTRTTREVPEISRVEHVVEDRVTWFSADGAVLRHVSLLDAMRRSRAWKIFEGQRPHVPDIFHSNSVEVLDGRIADRAPEFAAGNVLVSMRFLSAVVVLDPTREEIVWAMARGFEQQHDAEVLADGSLQLFDNLGGRYSAVRRYDVPTRKEIWSWSGSKAEPFLTRSCGSAELLPNGNTLLVESARGRAIELAPDGEIVWEWRSPYRGVEDKELVASLYDLVRVP